eukprot:gene19362-21282_t
MSYSRVLQVENLLAYNISKQFQIEGIVSPPKLCHGLHTVGALDNIDNNPSSTTAEGSLHGTAISIMQRCRTHADGEERSLKFDLGPFVNEINLPDSFAIVPACSLNPGAIAVPDAMPKKVDDFLPKAIAKEQLWIESASKSLTSENYSNQARS